MSHDDGAACRCVSEHRPQPLEYVIHHLDPVGMGGPDVPENRVWLCDNAHRNVHELLRAMLREDRLIPLSVFSEVYTVAVSRYAYSVAAEGYRRVVARRSA